MGGLTCTYSLFVIYQGPIHQIKLTTGMIEQTSNLSSRFLLQLHESLLLLLPIFSTINDGVQCNQQYIWYEHVCVMSAQTDIDHSCSAENSFLSFVVSP